MCTAQTLESGDSPTPAGPEPVALRVIATAMSDGTISVRHEYTGTAKATQRARIMGAAYAELVRVASKRLSGEDLDTAQKSLGSGSTRESLMHLPNTYIDTPHLGKLECVLRGYAWCFEYALAQTQDRTAAAAFGNKPIAQAPPSADAESGIAMEEAPMPPSGTSEEAPSDEEGCEEMSEAECGAGHEAGMREVRAGAQKLLGAYYCDGNTVDGGRENVVDDVNRVLYDLFGPEYWTGLTEFLAYEVALSTRSNDKYEPIVIEREHGGAVWNRGNGPASCGTSVKIIIAPQPEPGANA